MVGVEVGIFHPVNLPEVGCVDNLTVPNATEPVFSLQDIAFDAKE